MHALAEFRSLKVTWNHAEAALEAVQNCLPQNESHGFAIRVQVAVEKMTQKPPSKRYVSMGLGDLGHATQVVFGTSWQRSCQPVRNAFSAVPLLDAAASLKNAAVKFQGYADESLVDYEQMKMLRIGGRDIHMPLNNFIFAWRQDPVNARAVGTTLGKLFRVVSNMSEPSKGVDIHPLAEEVRQMFIHAYDAYIRDAFPHDDLRPLSRDGSDSLAEAGNLKLEGLDKNTYSGVALSLIESLSTLAVLGNVTEFHWAVNWLDEHPFLFDQDVRLNVFETTIRLLGGLLSAHMLATFSMPELCSWCGSDEPESPLLALARDLGDRLYAAYEESPTEIPYAWVNMRNGVMENEVTETNLAGAGTSLLEFAMLSRLTGEPKYEEVSVACLRKLWSMRSPRGLFGTSINVVTGEWLNTHSSIGFGADSYYEYLVKGYTLLGDPWYWQMFASAYEGIQRYMRSGVWYADVDMKTAARVQESFTSLQAFFPGLQAEIGDLEAGNASHRAFLGIWEQYGLMPERYMYKEGKVHSTMKYYPLRPELVESTLWLYQATHDAFYQDVAGRMLVDGLSRYARVPTGGFAAVKDVETMEQENHQQSFFLSETCKYLYLLFNSSFLHRFGHEFVFTTEGHPLPVVPELRRPHSGESLPERYDYRDCARGNYICSGLDLRVCRARHRGQTLDETARTESACHILDKVEGSACKQHVECGVDAETCRERLCSTYGFCYTPDENAQKSEDANQIQNTS